MAIDYISHNSEPTLFTSILFVAARALGIGGQKKNDYVLYLSLIATIWWTCLMILVYESDGPSSSNFIFAACWVVISGLSFVNCGLTENGANIAKETNRLEKINETLSTTRSRISDDADQLEETILELASEIEKYSKFNYQNATMTIINAFWHLGNSFRVSKPLKHATSDVTYRVIQTDSKMDSDGWEIIHLLALIQLVVPEQEWGIYFAAIDKSFNADTGHFHHRVFIEALTKTPKSGKWYSELFKQIDDDNDGLVNLDEVERAIYYIMKGHTENQINSLLEALDNVASDLETDIDPGHLDEASTEIFNGMKVHIPHIKNPDGPGVIFFKVEGSLHPSPFTPLEAFKEYYLPKKGKKRATVTRMESEPGYDTELYEQLQHEKSKGKDAFTELFPNLPGFVGNERYVKSRHIIEAARSLLKNAHDKMQEGQVKNTTVSTLSTHVWNCFQAPECCCVVQCCCFEIGKTGKCCCYDVESQSQSFETYITADYHELAGLLMNRFDVDSSGTMNMDEFDEMLRYLTSTKQFNVAQIISENRYLGAITRYHRIVRSISRKLCSGKIICACCGLAIRSGCKCHCESQTD